jgi:hypothetical protein
MTLDEINELQTLTNAALPARAFGVLARAEFLDAYRARTFYDAKSLYKRLLQERACGVKTANQIIGWLALAGMFS